MRKHVVKIAENHPDYSDQHLQLRRDLPVKPKVSTFNLSNMLPKNRRTLPLSETLRLKNERRKYAPWFMAGTARNANLVYVDECVFNLLSRRTRGRALVGQRAVRQVVESRELNLIIIMAISPEVGILCNGKCYRDSKCNHLLPLSNRFRSHNWP